MFVDLYPQFQRGRILKTEMLTHLRDYPRQLLDIHYQDYSDGIIAGADILVNEHHLSITRGIVKHLGRLYVLDHDIRLPYETTGKETVLKIRFKEKKLDMDFITYETDLVLDENTEIAEDELELSRFKLKKGARLRADYESFADFATEYNTLNLINIPYAGTGESTLHPTIMRYFAQEVLQSGSTVAYDTMMAMLCMNDGTVKRQVILHYLANRLGAGYRELTNEQIHRYLLQIVNEVNGGNKARMGLQKHGKQRMIVD